MPLLGRPVSTRTSNACALLLVAALQSHCGAVLIAYEPFDYPAGTLLGGHNGGGGWTGPWEPRPSPPRIGSAATLPAHAIEEGSLAGPAGLPTLGNHAVVSAVDFVTTDFVRRPFPNVPGADETSLWISFLGQRVGEANNAPQSPWPNNPYPRGANLGLFDNQTIRRAERLSIGNSTSAEYDEWSLIPEGQPLLREGTPSHMPKYSEMAWVVVRIDYVGDHAEADHAWMWVNPDPLAGAPSEALADITVLANDFLARDYSGLDYVRLFAGGAILPGVQSMPAAAQRIDELRIGTAWLDVNGGVPEPASAWLLVGAWLALQARIFPDASCGGRSGGGSLFSVGGVSDSEANQDNRGEDRQLVDIAESLVVNAEQQNPGQHDA
jgi:hypothetical protein